MFPLWFAFLGEKRFRNLMFPLWFAFLGGFFLNFICKSFHFVLCIPFFFGCFDLFMIGKVSSSSIKIV
jgi:hypothetical protein